MKKTEVVLNTTQQRVFDYITEFGSITSLQAFVDLGERRLSARVWELKDKGIKIDSEMVEVENRFHEKRHVKRYFIAGGRKRKSK
jgi:hypothetical protein